MVGSGHATVTGEAWIRGSGLDGGGMMCGFVSMKRLLRSGFGMLRGMIRGSRGVGRGEGGPSGRGIPTAWGGG